MIRWLTPLVLLVATPALSQIDRADLVTLLELRADEGNAEAQYQLGMMRHLGLGGAKDQAAALALFRLSAEAGDPLAAYMLGSFYQGLDEAVLATDTAEALKWKTVAAEAGYASAQHDVARLHFEAGEIDQALEWLTRGAQQGDILALRALASLHNSDAIPKDAARTFAYYNLALKQTIAPPQKQIDWIAKFAAAMTPEDKARGEAIVADWKIEPTPLTLKARAGLKAAETLVSAKD